MVFFKYRNLMHQLDHQAFDALLQPGEVTPYSGIYRCEICGHEVVSSKGAPMPLQDHHRHTLAQGPIRWRLIVRTIQKNRVAGGAVQQLAGDRGEETRGE